MPLNGDPRRCKAKAKGTGQQCQNPAMRGQMVCRNHGGLAPQNLARARERLEALVHPSLERLERMLSDDGTPPAVVITMVRDILDRTGYQARKIVELHSVDDGALEQALAAAEAELHDTEADG